MSDVEAFLGRVEELASRATEGPWRASILHGVTYEDGSSSHVAGIYPGSTSGPPPVFVTNSIDRRDAEFIAAARADVPALAEALRAVLDLHQPVEALNVRYNLMQNVCTGCGTDDGNYQHWPCPTVRAIERAGGA